MLFLLPVFQSGEIPLSSLDLGAIEQEDNQLLFIDAAADPLAGVKEGPYPDLDAAMAAVAAQIQGTCVKWVP